MNQKLNTGNLFVTELISNNLKNEKFSFFVEHCLTRHKSCDWGELEEEDKEVNTLALDGNQRILSAYSLYNLKEDFNLPNDKIWIITEWDRSSTTILFPSEY